MGFTLRPITPAEKKYTYKQSQQLSSQTGLIGHLRGDMDNNGNGFYTTFFDYNERRKTDEFSTALDEVINACRADGQYGGMLAGLEAMKRYCRNHPEASFEGNYTTEYGFRADTENHAFLLRLIPVKGDYNLYCYCYEREWLDHHLQKAERGIRFIAPNYTELFRLEDGDQIRIIDKDGMRSDRICRYIDDYHVEVENHLFHICEFAERMEALGSTVIPLRSSLPPVCYSTLPDTGQAIIIKRGENGYYRCGGTTDIDSAAAFAAQKNKELNVSKAQEAAMLTGSMFGWGIPGADPKNYDENGFPKTHRYRRDDRGRDR